MLSEQSLRRTRVLAVLTAAGMALVTACGSAVPHDEVVRAAQGSGGAGLTSDSGGLGATDTDAPAGNVVDLADPGDATGNGDQPPDDAEAPDTAGTAGASVSKGAPAAGGAERGGGAAPGAAGDKSPIIVASVGNYSGPAGSLLKSSAIGVQIWASAVNAKGGIAGHRVQVIVADDQSDPARYRSILQDMVENKKVVAFVGNAGAQTVEAGKAYLEQKKFPVIGSGDGSPTWQDSPMHFPVAGDADALVYGDFELAKEQGKTDIAVLSCVEASSCTGWKASARRFAPEIGVRLVYEADISVTQADYTAECLNARNSGATALAVIADGNTLFRVARSCEQQDYKPTYIIAAPDDQQTEKPALEGAITAGHTFGYFVTGTPAADTFAADVKKYAPNAPRQQYLATGYASGKVFEAAALKGIGTGKPSKDGVLKGLYQLPQGETLGGLTLPLRFRAGAPTKMVFCYYPFFIRGAKYVAPQGMKATCPRR